MTIDRTGLSLCSRYAFAPNWYHYCGPERQSDLLEYIKTGITDPGLSEILGHFETLFPYLRLIASSNHIRDPFDRRVVEAYWLGNRLLTKIPKRVLADHLADSLQLKRKTPFKDFSPMMERAITGTPNHTFHVLNIFIRTGHHAVTHTLHTMDQCRISWGQTVSQADNHYVVKTRPLTYLNGKLQLADPTVKTVMAVGVTPQKGQFVSIHWGYICEILDNRKRKSLDYFTRLAIATANKTV